MSAPQMPQGPTGPPTQSPGMPQGQAMPQSGPGAPMQNPTGGTPWNNPYAWTSPAVNQYANSTNVPTGYPGQQGLLPPQGMQNLPPQVLQNLMLHQQLVNKFMGMPKPPQGIPVTGPQSTVGIPGVPQAPINHNPLAGYRPPN